MNFHTRIDFNNHPHGQDTEQFPHPKEHPRAIFIVPSSPSPQTLVCSLSLLQDVIAVESHSHVIFRDWLLALSLLPLRLIRTVLDFMAE